MVASGLAVGLNKGHVVTKRESQARPSRTKGVRACVLSRAAAPGRKGF